MIHREFGGLGTRNELIYDQHQGINGNLDGLKRGVSKYDIAMILDAGLLKKQKWFTKKRDYGEQDIKREGSKGLMKQVTRSLASALSLKRPSSPKKEPEMEVTSNNQRLLSNATQPSGRQTRS